MRWLDIPFVWGRLAESGGFRQTKAGKFQIKPSFHGTLVNSEDVHSPSDEGFVPTLSQHARTSIVKSDRAPNATHFRVPGKFHPDRVASLIVNHGDVVVLVPFNEKDRSFA